MESQTKIQKQAQITKTKKIAKKERTGRWTPAESNNFQILLQKYGKNWAKIHQNLNGRTLSQIRSHAQKYFSKIGQKKVLEYQRRAKLIEAYEILENQKRLQKEIKIKIKPQTFQMLKKQENDLQTISQTCIENNLIQMSESITKLSEIIKEQSYQQNIIKQQQQIPQKKVYPFAQYDSSFLMYLIQQNKRAFLASNFGIEALIDEPGFKSLISMNV